MCKHDCTLVRCWTAILHGWMRLWWCSSHTPKTIPARCLRWPGRKIKVVYVTISNRRKSTVSGKKLVREHFALITKWRIFLYWLMVYYSTVYHDCGCRQLPIIMAHLIWWFYDVLCQLYMQLSCTLHPQFGCHALKFQNHAPESTDVPLHPCTV